MEERVIHISTSTIIKIVLLGVAIYLISLVWNLILILFVALILATLIEPFASFLQARKIPRAVAAIVVYLVLFGMLFFIIRILVPVVARDLPNFVESITDQVGLVGDNEIVERLRTVFPVVNTGSAALGSTFISGSGDNASNALVGIFSGVSSFLGGIFSVVLLLVVTFYLVVQDDPIRQILQSVVPDQYVPRVSVIVLKIREKLGLWIRGQLILSAIVGLLVFIGLSILHIKYAALIAVLAALFEFIPYLGPMLAAVPALFFAFVGGGPLAFFLVLGLYIVIQQLENHILVPKVMQQAVGLNPIVSILAILAGAQLAGVLGALIAIPVATAISVVVQDVLEKKREQL